MAGLGGFRGVSAEQDTRFSEYETSAIHLATTQQHPLQVTP